MILPLAFLVGETRERAGIHELAGIGVGGLHGRGIESFPLGADDDLERQVVFAGEFEVALVVGGHGHDRAGAVAHEHKLAT